MQPLLKKLNYKDQKQILILHAPDELQQEMNAFSQVTEIEKNENPAKTYEFVLIFVKSCNEIIRIAPKLHEFATPSATLWFAYPKKSSKKYRSDITRDEGWKPLGELGYEPVRQVAVDDDWSALRFKKADDIKTMKRSSAMTISKEGRKKVNQGDKKN